MHNIAHTTYKCKINKAILPVTSIGLQRKILGPYGNVTQSTLRRPVGCSIIDLLSHIAGSFVTKLRVVPFLDSL